MSYSDVLRANADMFEKAKIMLELDKRNAYLERGLSNKQINNEMSKELIDNKDLSQLEIDILILKYKDEICKIQELYEKKNELSEKRFLYLIFCFKKV